MKFNLHGFYHIYKKNRVIEIIASGTWNEETAIAFLKDIDETIGTLNGQTFTTLVDTQMWDLGTPEFQSSILEGTTQFIGKGLQYEAYVAGRGSVKLAQLKAMTPAKKGYERRFFESHIEAICWLEENGFSVL
jgi:hypothetical protein